MWLGGTLLLLVLNMLYLLGTLLGPEETPVLWVFFLVRLLAGFLTRSPSCCCVGVGVVVLVGFGVWLCVECCIVDASILLWSSV